MVTLRRFSVLIATALVLLAAAPHRSEARCAIATFGFDTGLIREVRGSV